MSNKARQLGNFLVSFVIFFCFVAIVAKAVDSLGAWDLLQAQQAARAAEATARKLEAETALLRERQAILQTRVLAFASVKDSLLVTVSYLAGGLALFLAVVVIGVLLLERGKGHERVY